MRKITQIVLLLFLVGVGSGLVYAQEVSLSERLSKKVSLDLRGMDIIDTIKFLAMKGDLNIVTSKGVSGRITLFLNDVTIADALDVILLTNNLACEKKKDIITIMTEAEYKALYGKPYIDKRRLKSIILKYADAANLLAVLTHIKSEIGKIIADPGTGTLILIDIPEKLNEMEKIAKEFDLPTIERVIPTVEEVFELAYAEAKEIEPEVSKSLTKDVGISRVNEKTNKLIVRDLPYNMERIRKLVREFDAKTRQVLIEAEIVEVTLSDDFSMGVDWKMISTYLDDLTFDGTFPFSAVGTSSLEVSVGTLAADDYEVALELIKSIGKVRIVSSPHIAVSNNEEAKFMVGSREAYVTTTITTGEVTTSTSEAVEFIDVGITLYITPTINKDGFVKMHIKPEISSVREWLETAEGNKVPIVETSNVETDVLIKDGRTIVIAGLIKDTIKKTVKRVPFWGDIPLIGTFFRNILDEKEKKETIIFLTPHIISGEEDLIYVRKLEKPRKPPKDEVYIKEKKQRKPAKR